MLGAAKKALLVTAAWAVSMAVPGINIVGLIVVMLPLWLLHDLGLPGLGSPNNGFFVPTSLGYALGAVLIWLLWTILFIIFQGPPKSRDEGS